MREPAFAFQYSAAGRAHFNNAAAPEQNLPAADTPHDRVQFVTPVARSGVGNDGGSTIRDVEDRFLALVMRGNCAGQCGTLVQVQHLGSLRLPCHPDEGSIEPEPFQLQRVM